MYFKTQERILKKILRKNNCKLLNLITKEYYHQPISKVSEITYYQNIPKNISPGLSLARFYKCEIEEDYWNYWKKKLPVEMEKYKNREKTNFKTEIEVYKFINDINKCKKKIEDLFNSEVYLTIKFALDNNLYAIAAEKDSDIIHDFEELRKDIQTTIAESDSMIASCNKFIQEIESNKKDNVFFFTIDHNIDDYKLHINNKYKYFNKKITMVRKAKKEFDFLLTGKRNRKLETLDLNEKDIDNISKNFLQ